MVSHEVLERVLAEVDKHVRASKGYETDSWINQLTPVDSIAADKAMPRPLPGKRNARQSQRQWFALTESPSAALSARRHPR